MKTKDERKLKKHTCFELCYKEYLYYKYIILRCSSNVPIKSYLHGYNITFSAFKKKITFTMP